MCCIVCCIRWYWNMTATTENKLTRVRVTVLVGTFVCTVEAALPGDLWGPSSSMLPLSEELSLGHPGLPYMYHLQFQACTVSRGSQGSRSLQVKSPGWTRGKEPAVFGCHSATSMY